MNRFPSQDPVQQPLPPHASMEIPTKQPIDKVRNGAMASALSVIIIFLIKKYLPFDMPPEVEGSLSILIVGAIATGANYAAAYFTPLKRREIKL